MAVIPQLQYNTAFAVYVKRVKPTRGCSIYISVSSEVRLKNRMMKNTPSQRKFIFEKFYLRKKNNCIVDYKVMMFFLSHMITKVHLGLSLKLHIPHLRSFECFI